MSMIRHIRAPFMCTAGAALAAFGPGLPAWIAGGLLGAVGLLALLGGE